MTIVVATILLVACSKNETPAWEYMVLPVEGSKFPTVYSPTEKEALEKQSNFKALNFLNHNFDATLNSYGKEGWELVDIYTTEETVFPNFGDAEYHTGIKENTRTATINFVFKRQTKK
ncbi:MAG: hypothetical protein PUE35_07545 [Bacteroidales bacterium]|nr:hypothetical protein [Bacteroidales bacterium]